MIILVKILGVAIFGLGAALIVYPDWMKKVMAFWKEDSRVYWVGVIRMIIGVLILIAAPGADQPLLPAFLGALFIISGTVIFLLGVEQTKTLIAFWEGQPELLLRVLAGIPTAFGAIIFFAV